MLIVRQKSIDELKEQLSNINIYKFIHEKKLNMIKNQECWYIRSWILVHSNIIRIY